MLRMTRRSIQHPRHRLIDPSVGAAMHGQKWAMPYVMTICLEAGFDTISFRIKPLY